MQQCVARHEQDIGHHQHGGNALHQPIPQAIMRASNDAAYHSHTPIRTVRPKLNHNTQRLLARACANPTP